MSHRQQHATGLDRIVLAAAELEAEERLEFLARMARENPGQITEARRLLAAAARVSDSFLALPAVDLLDDGDPTAAGDGSGARDAAPRATATPGAKPVSAEERYRLGPLIGRGGMAEVYRAHDHQLDRPVALKLLDCSDPETLSRCLREARAQARVRHRHVLEVYDTGELAGRPFIALRLVEGSTLGELAESSSLEEQVALLIQVAEGLDAAHRIGLIHRDVKPSNVLVEEVGGELTAFVSDFGIAAPATEGVLGTGAVAGTIPYLAPERLDPAARPDRRSDVWSFGVMSYRILTGALPFDGAGILEQLHLIRQARPLPPRQRLPALPADLEAIVLKCLAKDPAERYPTAREAAADLRRYLRGEVVEAHAASLAYRVTRFVLRHRHWVWLASALSALLVIALAVAAVLGWRAMRAEQRVLLRQDQAEDLISFVLLDLRDKLDRLGRLELIDDVGTEAMRYFAAVPASELGDRELARYATALHQLGEVRLRQGEPAAAVEAFEQSLTLARASRDRHPGDFEGVFDLGQSYFWVGYGRRELGELDLAQESFEAYLALSEELVAADPENRRWRAELGYAHSNLGTLHQDRGELEPARRRFQASLEIKERLDREAPGDPNLESELAWAHNALAVVLQEQGEPAAARRHFDAELAIRRALVAGDPRDARWRDDLAVSLNYLGHWLLWHGAWRASLEPFAEAQEIRAALVAADPDDRRRRRRLAINAVALGRARIAVGEVRRGLERFEDARRMLAAPADEPATPADRRELASAHAQLAVAHAKLGEPATAAEHADTAVDMLERLIATLPDDRMTRLRLGSSLIVRGDLEHAAGREAAARASWRRAAEILDSLAGDSRDREAQAPWALALLRLGARERMEPVLAQLHAEGFCDPAYVELCAPAAGQRVSEGG